MPEHTPLVGVSQQGHVAGGTAGRVAGSSTAAIDSAMYLSSHPALAAAVTDSAWKPEAGTVATVLPASATPLPAAATAMRAQAGCMNVTSSAVPGCGASDAEPAVETDAAIDSARPDSPAARQSVVVNAADGADASENLTATVPEGQRPPASAAAGQTQLRTGGGIGGLGGGTGGGLGGGSGGLGGGGGDGHAEPSCVPVVMRLPMALHATGTSPHSCGLDERSSMARPVSALHPAGTVPTWPLPARLSDVSDKSDENDGGSEDPARLGLPPAPSTCSDVRAPQLPGSSPLNPALPDTLSMTSDDSSDHSDGISPDSPVLPLASRKVSAVSARQPGGSTPSTPALPDTSRWRSDAMAAHSEGMVPDSPALPLASRYTSEASAE
eukprot:360315-Chlamydomonas_euryale.AAC.6